MIITIDEFMERFPKLSIREDEMAKGNQIKSSYVEKLILENIEQIEYRIKGLGYSIDNVPLFNIRNYIMYKIAYLLCTNYTNPEESYLSYIEAQYKEAKSEFEESLANFSGQVPVAQVDLSVPNVGLNP